MLVFEHPWTRTQALGTVVKGEGYLIADKAVSCLFRPHLNLIYGVPGDLLLQTLDDEDIRQEVATRPAKSNGHWACCGQNSPTRFDNLHSVLSRLFLSLSHKQYFLPNDPFSLVSYSSGLREMTASKRDEVSMAGCVSRDFVIHTSRVRITKPRRLR